MRKIVRVIAILFLVVGVVIGVFATYVYLTPSDEEKLYDQKHKEAVEKLKQAEAARGTTAEPKLAKEARDAAQSAEVWRRGYSERIRSNRFGVLASGGVAFVSFIVLLLTFGKRKNNAGISDPSSWSQQSQHPN